MNGKQVCILMVMAAALGFGSDSYCGTWKANPVKTKLSPGSPELRKSELMTIDDMGPDQYRVTRTTSDGKSDSYGLMFDGKEHTGKQGSYAVGMRLAKRQLRNTLKGPKGMLVSEWVVSADGTQLINTRKGNGTATGRPIDEVFVYDRIPDKKN